MFKTTMTGSFYRTKEIQELLRTAADGELGLEHSNVIQTAETLAVKDQLHPLGSEYGLNWVSNGEQRKSGYTTYIPNRFEGFSKTEKTTQQFSAEFHAELVEANPFMAKTVEESKAFDLPKIENRLVYTGEKISRKEAEDALKIAKEQGAERIFIPAPSPGVITVFYPHGKSYRDH